MRAQDLKNLLKLSYSPEMVDYNDFILDRSLSGRRVKVYVRNGKAYIVHRGTQGGQDILTDAAMGVGYKTNRFTHADKIQKEAETKYGVSNVTTLGHSLGAKITADVGGDSSQQIALNRPELVPDLFYKKSDKVIDVASQADPVSILKPITQKNGKEVSIKSPFFYNPLTEHKTDILDRLGEDAVIGSGLRTNKWLSHVKQYQATHKCSYKEALSGAKVTYNK